jgi:hypothetical protein
MDTNCYNLKEYTFDNPIFNSVDATYIIHLEGNGRLVHIEEQLKYYHPTKIVYIVFNKGFKKCEKAQHINKPPLDLIDAFFQCFKDANSKNYGNILILEDDFIFDKEILNRQHSNKIDIFLDEKNRKEEIYVYYIGAITYLQSVFGYYHNRLIFSTGTQSCIYSKGFIKYILNNVKQETINDWDIYINFNYIRYKYYTSLCYQTFPETENLKYWDQGSLFLKYVLKILKYNKSIMKLDIQPQPGFNIMESSSRFMFWFIIVTFILIIFFFIFFINNIFNGKFNKYKKNKNNNPTNFYLYIFYFILFILVIYPIIIFITLLLIMYMQSIYYNGL